MTRDERKRARLRRQKRVARQKGRQLAQVAKSVSKVFKRVTFEDLDGDQLLAYKGIHEWWNTSQECQGVPNPLTIGGYAGTGKSTLLAIALPVLKNPDGSEVRVAYCAYTGKAAVGLIAKGLPASTIHSLIYDVTSIKGEVHFELKDPYDVECELIVVDEASMVPDSMRAHMESLGIAILYTGDHGQLPPVDGRGNVMENPHLRLETIHRQAEDSGIIKVATMVRTGKPVPLGTYGLNNDTVKLPVIAIEDIELLSSADIILTYTNASKERINDRIRDYKGYKGIMPQVGERLICVRNNKETGLVNGLIVTILTIIDEAGHYLMDCMDETGKTYKGVYVFTNYFQGNPHPNIKGSRCKVDKFEFAYAVTGHKAQGSQWDHVLVLEEEMYAQRNRFKKQWLYTVLTRAQSRLTWISRFH